MNVTINGKEHPLNDGITIIGRGKDSDIQVKSPNLSRAHARFIISEGSVFIEDLGSRNGTYVNNERIEVKRELSKGDAVRFADITCSVVFEAEKKADITKATMPSQPAEEDAVKDEAEAEGRTTLARSL